MALISTDGNHKADNYESVEEVVRVLYGALADEISARNLYSKIIDSLKKSKLGGESEAIKRLSEIARDEIQHQGSLLYVITKLSSIIEENMEKGAKGE